MGSDKNTKGSEGGSEAKEIKYEFTPGVEIKIIIAVLFLMAFGLVMIFSASSYTASISAECNYDSAYYFKKQLLIILGSIVVAAIVNLIPYKTFKTKFFGIGSYIVSAVLILLLKTPLGIESGGATRWLNLGFFQLQVADAVKICMIIFMAYYISKYWKHMHEVRYIVSLWLLVAFQAGLILLISSNLSSCLILLLMVFVTTFIVCDKPTLHIIVLVAGLAIVAVFIMWLKANMPLASEIEDYPYQIRRFFAWLDPESYASSYGYQPLQSLYAIGSGGLLGKGLGNGTQKLGNIPEAQNDMIFAIICEELGIVGAVLTLLMYGYLLYQMFVVVRESRNLFGSIVVIGVMLHIIFQVVVNVCVAVNFFPNTGVSLPFISSGGSAILCTLIEIGLVVGIRRQQYNRKYSRLN